MVKSPRQDLLIPNVSVHELAFELFRSYRKREALVDGITGKSYTYFDLLRLCRSTASGLVRLGAKKGDVIAVLSTNSPEYAMIYMGAMSAGVTITTINPVYTVYELQKQLEDSGATYMYAAAPFLNTAQAAAEKYGKMKKIIVHGETPAGLVNFSELMEDDGKAYPFDLTFDLDTDVVALPYSSGTTGLPKGVELTHRNLVSNYCQYTDDYFLAQPVVDYLDEGKQATVLCLLPMYHLYGQAIITLFGLMAGNRIVTLPKFEPETFLSSIQKFKVNLLVLVPPLVIFMTKSPLVSKYDITSVITVLCAAAPLGKDTEEEFCKVVNIKNVYQGFGMTELSPVATMMPGQTTLEKHGSVGIPVANTQVQVVEIGGSKVLGPNEKGEIWVKGPQVMKGYLNKPEATRETIDEQRWLHTGDVGYYDDDGFFFIVDRIKELIKYKGFQVAPAELEALLLSHPGVSDAGVIGVPDPEAGELPKAFIVKKPGRELTAEDIHAFMEEHLTKHKQLRGGIEFVDQIPKSASGKILRRVLREM